MHALYLYSSEGGSIQYAEIKSNTQTTHPHPELDTFTGPHLTQPDPTD